MRRLSGDCPDHRARLSRRSALKGIAAGRRFSGLFSGCSSIGAATSAGGDGSGAAHVRRSGRSTDRRHHVPAGYNAQVLIRQATRSVADRGRVPARGSRPAPSRSSSSAPTTTSSPTCRCRAARAPRPGGSWARTTRTTARSSASRDRRARRAHARAVRGADGRAGLLDHRDREGRQCRRIVDESEVQPPHLDQHRDAIAGPAAGHPRMQTPSDPSRAARSTAPSTTAPAAPRPGERCLPPRRTPRTTSPATPREVRKRPLAGRHGITGRNLRYGAWSRYFERFSMDKEPNEPNRFGWIVEIDPYDPKSTPVKRTALGRGARMRDQAVSHDGRVAFYSGDDARMEYVYKFVTQERYDARARSESGPSRPRHALRGALRAQRQDALAAAGARPGAAYRRQRLPQPGRRDDRARRAGDLLGATPMDRPEDVEAHPLTGRVYVVCTFNETRKPDQLNPANPRPNNRYGHIVEIVPPLVNGRPDHAATECDWGFFLLGGNPNDPAHGARYGGPVSANGWLAAPDNVAFDPKGRIWISTDGQDDWAGFNDSLYAAQVNGPGRGVTRAFSTARVAQRSADRRSRPTARPCSWQCSIRATRKARASSSLPRAGPTSATACRRALRCSPSRATTAEKSAARAKK